GTYFVVVTNGYGSATSTVAQVTIFGSPVVTDQTTTTLHIFAGASPTLRAKVSGPAPAFQWSLNSSAIPGATSSSYTIANIQAGGTYTCVILNSYGSTAITPITVSVLAAPAAPFPTSVLADQPLSYFRLDEGSGTVAYDYVDGLNLTYTNVQLGMPGYSSTADPSETAAGFGFVTYDGSHYDNNYAGNAPSLLDFGAPTNSSVQFSVEAWVNASSPQSTDAGIISLGYGNGGEQFNLDCGSTDPAHKFRFFVRDSSGAVHVANGSVAPTDGNWHHVVGVCDEANGQIRLYIDGKLDVTSSIVTNSGILGATSPLSIGSRQSGNSTGYDNQFVGSIDDVAVCAHALSSSQVLAHYYGAGFTPVITMQPTNTTANEGATVTFYLTAQGSPPLAYQWYDITSGTGVPLSGQTNANLVLANVPVSANGNTYQATVTNLYGQVNSDPAQLLVVAGPPFVQQDIGPAIQVVNEGTMVTYAVVATGSAPLRYQWLQNSAPITSATNASYNFEAPVGTNVYKVTISNNAGSTSSSDATLVGLPVPKLNPSDFAYHTKITFAGYTRAATLPSC
ncbi:MAG: LamG-like jellyroll fold domain-containing protein, partial [Limisphaerales bacterium]